MTETPRDDSSPVADPYDLARFLDAQNERDTYASALEEIRRGRKVSHWIWFVFPQIAGLGHSATSKRFAIRSLEEARAYLAHPVLGSRLREGAGAMLVASGTSLQAVLGGIDANKFRSSMTFFARADPHEVLFMHVIDRWFDGSTDDATHALLGGQ